MAVRHRRDGVAHDGRCDTMRLRVALFLSLASAMIGLLLFVGCEGSVLDLGDSSGPTGDFVGLPPRWIGWSPKGDSIVYEQAGQLIVGSGADLNVGNVITGKGRYAHPYWSPDGRFIVYDYTPDRYHQANLWVRAVDGSAVPRRLTDARTYDFMPVWSRDGRWIAFHSRRSPSNNVWVVPADGGTPKALGSALANEGSLDWSPTSPTLAFEAFVGTSSDIWAAEMDGPEAKRFAGTAASDKRPRWRPDGRSIGFLSLASKGWNVWQQGTADGSEPTPITTVGDVVAFEWVFDGEAVAFLTADGGLHVQRVQEGSEPTRVATCVDFATSPDGRRYVRVEFRNPDYKRYADTFSLEP
ncbi:hypothetical protein FJZ36_15840 [Candidatus Poribacteria bacterium]|nr:hypothetical protein [Candidatus Poribacteria bacterium]